MKAITFTVLGEPAPQGSKRWLGNGVLIESSRKVKPWRQAVVSTAADLGLPLWDGPVALSIVFLFPRPKGHHGKRGLRPSAPRYMGTRPDLDKLARSTCDGLTGVVIRDDAQIVRTALEKRYCHTGELPGAIITLIPLVP